MATDEYFLNLVEQKKIKGILRFYTWSPLSISIGCFFKTKHLKFKKIKKNKITIVRRITGGNAILHDNDFTYCLILQKGIYNLNNKKNYYLFIADILKKALEKLGIDSIVNTNLSIRNNNPDCFDSISQYEISTNNGVKLIGSAQKISKNTLLQHGSFFHQYDQRKITEYFIKNNKIKSLNKYKNNKFDYNDISKYFKQSFNNYFYLNEYSLSKMDENLIEKLIKEKYSTNEWTFKK